MFSVDTVYVVVTSRGPYVAWDLLRALRWSSEGSHYTVIVDRAGTVSPPADLTDGYSILAPERPIKASDAFVAGTGIKWCIDQGMQARQYMILSDECVIMQRGIDTWALEQLRKTQVGILGVRDRLSYEDAYSRVAGLMDSWGMPHGLWAPASETLHEAVLYLSGALAQTLFENNLLVLDGVEHWPLPYGPFISWAAQMLGFYQVGWGSMDQQILPLYVNHSKHARCQPAPHILNTKFVLYYSVRNVVGFTEERIRETFKKLRGETGKDFEPIRPSLSPKPPAPQVTP
jgi:hypothetical protein